MRLLVCVVMLTAAALAGCAENQAQPVQEIAPATSTAGATDSLDLSVPWESHVARWQSLAEGDESVCTTALPSNVCVMVCLGGFSVGAAAVGDDLFEVEAECNGAQAGCTIFLIPFCLDLGGAVSQGTAVGGSCLATGTGNGFGICWAPTCGLLCAAIQAEMQALAPHYFGQQVADPSDS